MLQLSQMGNDEPSLSPSYIHSLWSKRQGHGRAQKEHQNKLSVTLTTLQYFAGIPAAAARQFIIHRFSAEIFTPKFN